MKPGMTLAAVAIAILAASAAHGAETISAKGRVESVTLFRGQALVTRLVPVEAKEGAVQLTVTELPEAADGNSLSASGGAGLQVRAVRFRTQATGEAPEGEAAILDDQIAALDRKLRECAHKAGTVKRNLEYLDRLDSSFVAPTAQTEMTRGVLNAETLSKVTEMLFQNRNAMADQTLKLSEESRDIQKQLDLLRRKRSELAASHSKTLREAIVFLDKTGAAAGSVRLNYVVGNASWSPVYNVRGTPGGKEVRIEFGALVQQTSGEDWDSASLTLSTAAATLSADGPAIAPLRLNLTSGRAAYAGVDALEKKLSSFKSVQRDNVQSLQGNPMMDVQAAAQWNINAAVSGAQIIELNANPDDIGIIRKVHGRTGSSLAVNYPIGGKVSVANRHDGQLVEIAKLAFPAVFFCEATPLLTEYIYRYAEATNEGDLSLLEGSANVYMGEEYVGTVNLPLVARGQKVTVGLGINPQIRAWREFVSKEERGQLFGGNKQALYKYRIVLENYSAAEETVRVLDRIPVQTEQVKVTLGALKDNLSADAEYRRARLPQGLLRWDMPVPAHAARGTAKLIEYSYTLEYDEKLHIAEEIPAPAAAEMKADFDMMLRERSMAH